MRPVSMSRIAGDGATRRIAILAGILVLTTACMSQETSDDRQRTADNTFGALQARGKIAMGVDQYASSHQFEELPDGGRIELQQDAVDSAAVAAIRAHLREIEISFEVGDFTTPFFVHAGEVPGTAVMRARKDKIRYTFAALPRGGEVRISTSDTDALAAIHQFLAFQREEHHVGSPRVSHQD